MPKKSPGTAAGIIAIIHDVASPPFFALNEKSEQHGKEGADERGNAAELERVDQRLRMRTQVSK